MNVEEARESLALQGRLEISGQALHGFKSYSPKWAECEGLKKMAHLDGELLCEVEYIKESEMSLREMLVNIQAQFAQEIESALEKIDGLWER